jgi:hypothetical protein
MLGTRHLWAMASRKRDGLDPEQLPGHRARPFWLTPILGMMPARNTSRRTLRTSATEGNMSPLAEWATTITSSPSPSNDSATNLP